MLESTAPVRADELVRRGLKFSQLRLLNALREVEQIGAAAQQTGMTQPAASRLLAQLEEMVGARLYTRHSRGITLTESGRLLADQAALALRSLDLAHQRIGEIGEGVRGSVRLGSVTGPALEILLPAISEARFTYPDIELSVAIDTSDKLSEALLSRDIDFYIGRIPPTIFDTREFEIDVIGPENITLVVRLDHPLTKRESVTIEDCLDYDWVTQPPGNLLRRTAENYLLARGSKLPERVVGTTSVLFTLALVKETDAIAPLAKSVADFFIESGGLGSRLRRLHLPEDMRVVDFGIVTRANEPLSPSVEKLMRLVSRFGERSRTSGARHGAARSESRP